MRVALPDLRRLDPLVDRPRLIQLLERSNTPGVVIAAPAGYGKSVLLAQWATRDSRPFASIALSDSHNDPVVLFGSMIEAIDRVEAVPDEVSTLQLSPQPPLELILNRLEQAIHVRHVPMVLVLDELEKVDSPDSLLLVEAALESMPPGSRIAVATRSTTPPHIGRLRANRLLTEIGRRDLVMTRRESAELLRGIGLELSPEQLDTLVSKTEGWPAALYLSGLALSKEPDLAAAVERFAGDERILVDYIAGELLSQYSQPCIQFLTRMSILDRFSGELCDAVLHRSGSAKTLRKLSRANMLLIPLDRRDEWFRFHALLSDTLRSELLRMSPQEVFELHRRASAWWSEQGDAGRAIHHSIEAWDFERAGELIWAAVPEYMARGRYTTMKRWLDRIGGERIVTDPHLSLTVAHGHLSRGEGGMAEYWGGVTHRLLDSLPRSAERDSLVTGVALLDAVLARGGMDKASDQVELALDSLSGESPWRAECFLMGGIAHRLAGRADEAREMLTEAARCSAIWGVPILQVLGLAELALLSAEENDWQVAQMLASQARAQVDRSGLQDYPTMALVYATSALIRARDQRGDGAAVDLRTAMGLLSRLDQFASWYEAQVHAVLADTAVALNDIPLAAEMLEGARRFLKTTRGAPALVRQLEETAATVESMSADSVGDLTAAELRVLRFLPTHLSFPEIAAELYVSPNTVKTQAQAAYRKLAVSSRREAVERARGAGLLGSGSPR